MSEELLFRTVKQYESMIASLRAELAESQAREAATHDMLCATCLSIARSEDCISPAAKALLERAERGDRAIEALRAAGDALATLIATRARLHAKDCICGLCDALAAWRAVS